MKTNTRVADLEAENAHLKTENERLEKLIDYYQEQLRLAQHRRYGASSEKTECPEQLGLFNEPEALADEVPETEEITYKRKKCKGKRKEFYENLPTEQIIHELPEDQRVCPDCGGSLHECGREVLRREVRYIPAQMTAEEHIQIVYGCRPCEQKSDEGIPAPMIKSQVPAPVIPGSGVASPSLLAYIFCNKYVLGLPLYRQEQELKRQGIHISRQTMANWMITAAARWLFLIYVLLKEEMLTNDILHADETSLQVIKEDGRSAKQKSYMWMYHTAKDSPRHAVLFEYQPTREGEHPLKFLKGYQGFLHVDAYAGYRGLEDQGVTLVECWAHVRRKFDESLKALKKEERANATANTGLEYCNQMFRLERKFDEENLTFNERRQQRELESKPVADAFFEWCESILGKTLPKNTFGRAVRYALNQKPWLVNFLQDGRLELSNNRAERCIRPFTIGRKNWLFSYSAKGAKASAIAYSIIETAQANGLVPFLYLQYLFETLPNIPADRIRECMPWNPAVQEACGIPAPK